MEMNEIVDLIASEMELSVREGRGTRTDFYRRGYISVLVARIAAKQGVYAAVIRAPLRGEMNTIDPLVLEVETPAGIRRTLVERVSARALQFLA